MSVSVYRSPCLYLFPHVFVFMFVWVFATTAESMLTSFLMTVDVLMCMALFVVCAWYACTHLPIISVHPSLVFSHEHTCTRSPYRFYLLLSIGFLFFWSFSFIYLFFYPAYLHLLSVSKCSEIFHLRCGNEATSEALSLNLKYPQRAFPNRSRLKFPAKVERIL